MFVPVSDATRYHHNPRTVPAHEKFTRCAVSTAYTEPKAIDDAGTAEAEYNRSPEPDGTIVDVGTTDVLVVVEDGEVVEDEPGVVVEVVEVVAPCSKSGEIQYSDAAYDNVGNTGTAEYSYMPFLAPATDAGAVMHPDADVTERSAKPFNVYPYAPFG